MKGILVALIVAVSAASAVYADEYVNGYYRSDGTYVQGYYRSSPNQYKYDNYSSQGNTNPYTGEKGSQRNEFSNPPEYNKSYWGNGTTYYND